MLFDDDSPTAIDYLNKSIHHFVAVEGWVWLPECLERLAYAYICQEQYQRAHWLLVIATQMRVEEGNTRPPAEEVLYEQAWEQLNAQGFTRENTSDWVTGRARDQISALISQDLAEAPSIPLLDVAAGR